MPEQYLTLETLEITDGYILDTSDEDDAAICAWNDYFEDGGQYKIIWSHPHGEAAKPTSVLIGGVVYQLEKSDFQPGED